MNQPKNSRKNKKADTPKTMPEDNPFSTVIKTGEAPKLGSKAQGMVLYEVAQNSEDDQLYFRIAGQSGGAGLHSKQWILLSSLLDLIESQGDKPWKSQVYKSLYSSGSVNNQGFCAAITRSLNLAAKAESSIYMHTKSKDYEGVKAELLALAE
ncbi:hypothetical protein BOO92_20280 [Vibrio navarrensis]|uniref:hypothetical protein n=1 Tax=Vibrio navarrensis TaxID=29495 RepID=UPI00186742F2|nr:hypothetical protein [Vibrio navarrensis]MBE3659007.1 hypothetical protein [Vibrio navarrensis]